jgi:nucleoside-diphosphate-sugar epimerase
MIALTSSKIGSFNISGPTLSINEAAEVFCRLSGTSGPKVLGHDVRPGGEYSLTSDSSLASEILRWDAELSFEQMVTDFLRSNNRLAEKA